MISVIIITKCNIYFLGDNIANHAIIVLHDQAILVIYWNIAQPYYIVPGFEIVLDQLVVQDISVDRYAMDMVN